MCCGVGTKEPDQIAPLADPPSPVSPFARSESARFLRRLRHILVYFEQNGTEG